MKNLLNGITGRTFLVLLVGITLSHIISLTLTSYESHEALNLLRDRLLAERMAVITRLVDSTPPNRRAEVAKLVDSPGVRVALNTRSPSPGSTKEGERPHFLEHILQLYLGDRATNDVRVSYHVGAESARSGEVFPRVRSDIDEHAREVKEYVEKIMSQTKVAGTVRASIPLPDSTWLEFATPLDVPRPFASLRFELSIVFMIVAVLVLSLWAVWRWAAPLTSFAHAAERLGVDVNAPPLPETGPREVVRTVKAFNEMQARIRRFVEDRTQMIAAIAHDLGTPITRLRLRIEEVGDVGSRQKMLADLDEMEGMISSTLAFARDDATDEPRETFDLVSLLESICNDMIDAGEVVELNAEGRVPYSFRLVALRRAFTNLIENALKYGDRADVSVTQSTDQVVVAIEDNGPGIPTDMQGEVFKPFVRLETSRSRETGGTGLGLTVARSIVRAHGGDIILTNRAEGGLRVEVTLPR